MPRPSERFLNTLARDFAANRLAAIAENFVYPLPFYAEGGIQVFGSAATLTEGLALYHDAAAAAGLLVLVPRIVAQGLPVRGYSNVWVEWDHMDAAGVCRRTSQVRYVFCRPAAALFPRIELVEYSRAAFPEIPASFAMTATA